MRECLSFIISDLSIEFPEVLKTTLFRILTDTLGYRKLYSHWVMKMLTRAHKDQRLTSANAFLDHFHREGVNVFPISSLVTKHGFYTSMLSQNNNPCSGVIRVHPN